ncbi:MAG: DUF3224 domain-containing protein [Gemmatimonadota bacterium]|nr:DUF3224 domain-containing protein [Gemmatimonadota bacterium]
MSDRSVIARGEFDVKMTPEAVDAADGIPVSRLALDKQYRGALEGTGRGVMVSATTPVKGSAGYVAIERFTGTLHGRQGSFVMQHAGMMTRGAQQLTITIVPDSGTGALTGIKGSCGITIADGKHSYEIRYSLTDTSTGTS